MKTGIHLNEGWDLMNYKIIINRKISKSINIMTKTEKINFRNSIDMMESIGQVGEPLFKKMNIWKFRCENLRILYKKTPTEIHIFKILKGFDPTIS